MTEEKLHKSIIDFILFQYPKVIFNTDSSGIKLTMGQAMKMKKLRSDNGFPDITIYEPKKNYSGLFLEVKKETPYKKDGILKTMTRYRKVGKVKVKYDHLQEQNKMHQRLINRGYKAEFVWSLEMAQKILHDYFN